MNAKETKNPLFMRTYSKVRPKRFQKSLQSSPVFPGDNPKGFEHSERWITGPTGSPLSEISQGSDLMSGQAIVQENSSDQESFVSFSFGPAKKQSKKFTSTPLINVGNILAQKPRLSTFKRVASPLKQTGTKICNKAPQMMPIQEMNMDSTSTDDELPLDNKDSGKTCVASKAVKPKETNSKPRRKIGWPGFNFLVKGQKVQPLYTYHRSTNSEISSGISDTDGSTIPSQPTGLITDMEEYSDAENTSLSGATDSDSTGTVTLTDDISSNDDDDDKTLEEDDLEIEIMRDLPDDNMLSVRGKKAQMSSKSRKIKVKNAADFVKLPLGSLSLDANSSLFSSRKRVSFHLCSKDREEVPDVEMGKAPIQFPKLAPKTILKKTNSNNRENSFSSSVISCAKKTQRMSSTPTRASKASKKDKMMQLSFDVSSVHLPSFDASDLIIQGVKESTQNKVAPPIGKKVDVSAVQLPSFSVSDLLVQGRKDTTQPTQDNMTTLSGIKFDVSDVHLPSDDVSGLVVTGGKDVTQSTQEQMTPTIVNKNHSHLQTKQAWKPHNTTQSGNASLKQNVSMSEEAEMVSHNSATPKMTAAATHATPRSQLKRCSPESHVPVAPSKRRSNSSRCSSLSDMIPMVTSSSKQRQRKRLEYRDKAAGPPECCITKLTGSTCKFEGVKIVRYVSPHVITCKQIQEMPTDVLEVLFS